MRFTDSLSRCWMGMVEKKGILLGLILLLGLGVRLLYLNELNESPDFHFPDVDAGYHEYWAKGLAYGDWSLPPQLADPQIQSRPFFRPPGYPYFIAGIYKLFPDHARQAVCILQMALGLLNCLLAFLLGRKCFGRNAGLVFAAMMAFYWSFIFYEGELQTPVLHISLLLGLLLTLTKWRERRRFPLAAAAGALAGLSALLIPGMLLVIPVMAAWMVWQARQQAAGWRVLTTGLAGVLLGAAVAIAPATIRNAMEADDPILISANGGINLFIGNNPTADGYCSPYIGNLGFFGTCFDYAGIVRQLEHRLGHPVKYSEASQWFTREALGYIRDNPGRVARLTVKKALLFWGPMEVGHNKEDHYVRQFSPLLSHLPGNFALVLTLFVLGLALWAGVRREQAGKGSARETSAFMVLLLGIIAVYFLSYLPFFIAARYRIPIIPLLLLPGAAGLCRLGELVSGKRWRAAGVTFLAGCALYAVFSINWGGYQPKLHRWHFDRGVAFMRQGDKESAIREYRAAIEAKPDYEFARANLATLLEDKGDTQGAVLQYKTILAAGPNPQAYHNLGMIFLRSGKLNEAIDCLRRAAKLQPSMEMLRCSLGEALRMAGHPSEAEEEFRQAIRYNPTAVQARACLGNLCVASGKLDQAITYYREALAINPNMAPIRFNLGVLLTRNNQGAEGERLIHEALQQAPGLANARQRQHQSPQN